MPVVSTHLGDTEYLHFTEAVSKSGGTPYSFIKEAILRHADFILAIQETPIVTEMVEALRARKWTLYQLQDFSDKNHRAWLQTRFPKAMNRQVDEAISQFRIGEQVKR